MTKQTQALKMALRWFTDVSTNNEDEVIQACKEALAQLAQEPVAWVKDNLICPENNYETTRTEEHPKDLGWTPLYSHPAPQPAQEPYGWIYNERIDDTDHAIGYYYTEAFSYSEVDGGIPIYIHPALSWQGLSDDEIETLIPDTTAFKCEVSVEEYIDFARAIEQALKEKNNGT